VYHGYAFFSPSISKKIIDEFVKQTDPGTPQDSYETLTDREREVLQLLAEGFAGKEIADQLHISIKTVGVHRINLMHKLNLHSQTELTKYAIRKGIITLDQ
jgi:DNA-binding NarL/FixJ family response regulator